MATADLVVRGGRVFTAADGGAWATGFAAREGRLVAVTDDDRELDALVDAGTRVLELDGACVVPGLFDAHAHPASGGRRILRPSLVLAPIASLDEILRALDAWAAGIPDGRWILAGAWNATLTAELGSAASLARFDAVSHGHPVILSDESGHNVWANTAAMTGTGLGLDGAEWPDGFGVDPDTGVATGLLMERAADPVRDAAKAAHPETVDEFAEFELAAWEVLLSFGITGIQDAMMSYPELQATAALDREGRLPGWVSGCLDMTGIFGGPDFDADVVDAFARAHAGERLRTDFTKLAQDGVPTTRTAGMVCAYLPDHEHGDDYHGIVYQTADELAETLRGYRALGRSTKVHCAGDRAVQVAIDAFAILRAEGSTLKYHIAHGQFVTPEDRARMADLDVVAEISPYIWYPGPIPYSIEKVLPEPINRQLNPNRELTDLGVLVAAGSDWPVVPSPNVWEGIAGLVTRADPRGVYPGTLWPEQAVTLEEALRIFSINGARAAGFDDVIGSLEVGKSADFVVLDRDVFTVAPDELGATTVVSTYVAGERVYGRET